jgi:hypothetical protein
MESWDCHFGTVAKSIIAAAFGRQESTKELDLTTGFSRTSYFGGGTESWILAFQKNMYNICIVEHLCYTPIDWSPIPVRKRERDVHDGSVDTAY